VCRGDSPEPIKVRGDLVRERRNRDEGEISRQHDRRERAKDACRGGSRRRHEGRERRAICISRHRWRPRHSGRENRYHARSPNANAIASALVTELRTAWRKWAIVAGAGLVVLVVLYKLVMIFV
jgi:hypothetical protein